MIVASNLKSLERVFKETLHLPKKLKFAGLYNCLT